MDRALVNEVVGQIERRDVRGLQQRLARRRLDPNLVLLGGNTPLMLAVCTEQPDLARWLLEAGADPTHPAAFDSYDQGLAPGDTPASVAASRARHYFTEMVKAVVGAKMVLFLGRGVSASVAAEGALKLMEVAYIPCIAYPSGEMKHGPIALLEKDSPVIVIAPRDAHRDKTLSNLQECRARGAKVILIHEEGDEAADLADIAVPVPATVDFLTPLLTVLPLQLLAYQAGLVLERDIDRPRNLAKSVTVE